MIKATTEADDIIYLTSNCKMAVWTYCFLTILAFRWLIFKLKLFWIFSAQGHEFALNIDWTEKYFLIVYRITWCVVVVLALLGVLYVSYLLQVKFFSSLIATVVETTFFPVFEVPYPAVTLCNYNRINWERVPAAIDLLVQNITILAPSRSRS